MGIKKITGTTPTRRFMTGVDRKELTTTTPEKNLTSSLAKTSGRDNRGHVSTRHKGGRHKRLYRLIDFRRDKYGIEGRVVSVEYDPNRSCFVSLIVYLDGEKRYVLAPEGLMVGAKIVSGEKVDPRLGNAAPLKNMPVGSTIHNVEMVPGSGGKLARSAGSFVTLMAIEDGWAHLKLPSGEVRKVSQDCFATFGTLGNADWKNVIIGKAGRSRHLGRKPTVRGVAMTPRDHPHGGGEGRSGIGMKSPKTPWGKFTLGKRTRNKNKSSSKLILQRRK